MKYNTTRRNNSLHNGNITRRMNSDITGGGFRENFNSAATSATDSLKRTATKIKDLVPSIPNIQDLGVLTSFFKMFLQIVPDNVWKLTAESTLNKICETVRDADTAVPSDPENTGCTITIEIIKKVNELIEKLIVGINMQKMQQKVMEKLMEKMKDPLDEIMNQECIALKIMDSLLSKKDLKNFLFVYFISAYVMELQESQGNRLLDFINNEDIDNYFKYLSEQKGTVIDKQSENDGKGVGENDGEGGDGEVGELGDLGKGEGVNDEKGVGENDGKGEDNTPVDPEILKMQNRLVSMITEEENQKQKQKKGGGTFASLRDDAVAIKDTAETVIKSFNSLMQTMITTIMSDADEDANKPETEESNKKIFLQPRDMANRILNAASFHLEKPEGRQMYLRQFEKLISRSINDISTYDALMIPLFKQCLKNDGFINLLDDYIRNDFNIPETEDNILVKNDPFELTKDNTEHLTEDLIEELKESIELFLKGFEEKVQTRLKEINPVETIYNDIEGSKCKTYGSIPTEIIDKKRKRDQELEQNNPTADSIAETYNNKSDFKKEGTYADMTNTISDQDINGSVDQNGGNIRKSRNKKYLPKKQKQTRRKR